MGMSWGDLYLYLRGVNKQNIVFRTRTNIYLAALFNVTEGPCSNVGTQPDAMTEIFGFSQALRANTGIGPRNMTSPISFTPLPFIIQ